MNSNLSIGDPYVLAAYTLPSSSKRSLGKTVALDERPFILASHSAVSRIEDGLLTVAVQGDGIHVLDLAGLHPVSSHTSGPSTSFYSTPVTVLTNEDNTAYRRTYVTVDSSKEIRDIELSKRVVWSWKEEVDGQIGSSQNRVSTVLPYDAEYLIPELYSETLFVISKSGRVMNTNLELSTPYDYTSVRDEKQKVFKVFSFLQKNCEFALATGIPPNGTVIIIFTVNGKDLCFSVVGKNEEGKLVLLDDVSIPDVDAEQLLDISCDASGHISILETSGSWRFFKLDALHSEVRCALLKGDTLKLKDLSFTSKTDGKAKRQASVLSLGSSFVLLAAITSKPEICLLLWDVQYGVLLSSSVLPIPSTLERSPSCISIKLVKGSSSQALLLLEPMASESRPESVRASVLVIPYTVPSFSTIANALGKGDSGAKWLEAVSSEENTLTDGKEVMLMKLQEAVEEERVVDADKIFFNWVKSNETKIKGKSKMTAIQSTVSQDVDMDEVDVPQLTKPIDYTNKNLFDYAFVTRILSIVLQSDLPPGKPYSPKICRYLVTKNLVSHSMINGGILSVLQQHNDWETIRECFIRVVDIPESEALRLLNVVIQHHKSTKDAPAGDEPMADDQPQLKQKHRKDEQTNVPPLASFLAHIVEYPASPPAWRKAIQEHFSDIVDLMLILDIIEEWLRIHANKDLPLGNVELSRNEHNVPIPVISHSKKLERVKGVLLPSLDRLLNFTQAILDSSFLSLLQNPSTYDVLRRISSGIAPLITVNEDLGLLCGPLAPFSKAQAKAVVDASSKKKRGEEVDWRKRRKQAMEQANLNLGPYQVEELVF